MKKVFKNVNPGSDYYGYTVVTIAASEDAPATYYRMHDQNGIRTCVSAERCEVLHRFFEYHGFVDITGQRQAAEIMDA